MCTAKNSWTNPVTCALADSFAAILMQIMTVPKYENNLTSVWRHVFIARHVADEKYTRIFSYYYALLLRSWSDKAARSCDGFAAHFLCVGVNETRPRFLREKVCYVVVDVAIVPRVWVRSKRRGFVDDVPTSLLFSCLCVCVSYFPCLLRWARPLGIQNCAMMWRLQRKASSTSYLWRSAGVVVVVNAHTFTPSFHRMRSACGMRIGFVSSRQGCRACAGPFYVLCTQHTLWHALLYICNWPRNTINCAWNRKCTVASPQIRHAWALSLSGMHVGICA